MFREGMNIDERVEAMVDEILEGERIQKLAELNAKLTKKANEQNSIETKQPRKEKV